MGGSDKSAFVVDGRRLLDVALDALGGAGRRVVVGGSLELPAGVVRVTEEPPGGGPLAALAAGLVHVKAPVVVVLAADLPFVGSTQVAQLVAAVRGDGVVAVDEAGRDQPLLAAYDVGALRRALPTDVVGAPMRALLAALPALARVRLTGEPAPWFDCDTPDDLAQARNQSEPGR